METNSLSRRQHAIVATFLFFLTFLVYWRSQNTFISDTMWAVHITSSIINSGDINLDEYEQVVEERAFYGLVDKRNNGHILPYFPVGNSILAIPIVWIIENIKQFPDQQSFSTYLQQTSPLDPFLIAIQHFSASLITALIIPVLYYIGVKRFNSTVAILGVLVFAFGTSAYSTASRVLWQHGPSMLMLTIAIALFIKAESDSRAIRWAGIPLAFSFVIRPTNSIPIIILTIVVLLCYRKQFLGYVLGAMIIAVPFLWLNWNSYESVFPPYYMPTRVGASLNFIEALVGNLISPGRGLFVFSPVLIFALYGIVSGVKHKDFSLVDSAFAIIIGLHWIMISTFSHWWGGDSYGPRFFTDILPFMMYFLFMGLYELSRKTTQKWFRYSGMGMFIVLAFVSISIHYIGAQQRAVYSWFRWPVQLETHAPFRLWDWEDLAFLRTPDDWPFSALPLNVVFDLHTYQKDDALSIPMLNNANNEYLWEIKLPYSLKIVQISGIDYSRTDSGVPIVVGETALGVGSYQWLHLKTENSLDSFVDPSLGAIMITAKTVQGEVKSKQIVPVSIVGHGLDWKESSALSESVWLPEDISINGDKANYSLYGLFGIGWYPLERSESYAWRWAESPAELYVFSAEPRSLLMEFVFSSLHDNASPNGFGDSGQLEISAEDQDWVGQVNRGETHQVPLSLEKGWNTIVFNLDSGNFQLADVDASAQDQRELSFSLDSLNFISTD